MLKDHKALELDKILLQLANETTCPDAAELAQKIELCGCGCAGRGTDPRFAAQ